MPGLMSWVRSVQRPQFIIPPGTVICFEGNLGAGKTLSMMLLAYLFALSGLPVYSNFESFANDIQGIRHLRLIRSGLLCIDEAQVLIDARNFGDNAQRR